MSNSTHNPPMQLVAKKYYQTGKAPYTQKFCEGCVVKLFKLYLQSEIEEIAGKEKLESIIKSGLVMIHEDRKENKKYILFFKITAEIIDITNKTKNSKMFYGCNDGYPLVEIEDILDSGAFEEILSDKDYLKFKEELIEFLSSKDRRIFRQFELWPDFDIITKKLKTTTEVEKENIPRKFSI